MTFTSAPTVEGLHPADVVASAYAERDRILDDLERVHGAGWWEPKHYEEAAEESWAEPYLLMLRDGMDLQDEFSVKIGDKA